MLRKQETDLDGSEALKTSPMPLMTGKFCPSCLLNIRLRPSRGCANYGLLWLLLSKARSPSFFADEDLEEWLGSHGGTQLPLFALLGL